jgi:glycosyltransferase involved in cell wall biosynthesis
MERPPLVTVIVLTYNSSEWVVETLESIYNQTYDPIELIVTDDGSTDNTIGIAEQWLDSRSSRFSAWALVRSQTNTGISANCNRGLARAKGTYIKFIGGDDRLLEDCVSFDIQAIQEAMVLCTAMLYEKDNATIPIPDSKAVEDFFSLPAKAQMRSYLRRPIFLNSPSLFFKKEIFDRIGAFDERITLMDDLPFITKLLTNGYHLTYADRATVVYRLSPGSITGKRSKAFLESQRLSYQYYAKPYLRWTNFIDVLVLCESTLTFSLEKRGLNGSWMHTASIRFRPSRFFVEKGLYKKIWRR